MSGRRFGPGLLVTAAFVGPGTIATASSAGAGFGYAMIAACLAATLCVPSALRLVRTRGEAVTSAA